MWEDSVGSDESSRPRLQRWAAALGITGVLALGTLASAAAIADDAERATTRDGEAAREAAAAVRQSVDRSMASLRGAGGLGTDGSVTPAEFEAYAAEVIRGETFASVAYEVAVTAGDRPAFERDRGITITERGPAGTFVPAGPRARYVAVVDIVPADSPLRSTLGYDIASDPARAAAMNHAATTGEPALSEPTDLSPGGGTGYFVIHAVRSGDPGGEPVGYVSSTVSADSLLGHAREQAPPGSALLLSDGGSVLAGEPNDGAQATVSIAGREWTVTVDDPAGRSPVLPITLGAATLILAAFLTFSTERDRRFERANERLAGRLRANSIRNGKLATVARQLSGAADLDTVIQIIATDVATVVGADHADVGLLLDSEHLSMSQRHPGLDPDLVRRYARVPVAAPLATAQAVRERRLVLVEDLTEYHRDHPEVLADIAHAGVTSSAAVPLTDADGVPLGVLGLAWAGRVQFNESTRSTIETLGEMCGQTLRRTQLATRAQQLADLATALAAANTPTDVAAEIVEHGRSALGATFAMLRVINPASGALESLLPSVVPEDITAAYRQIRPDSSTPAGDAYRLDTQVWIADIDEYAARYPQAAEDARRVGFHATATLPLHSGDGTPVGVIGFAWPSRVRFDHLQRSTATAIASIAGQTIERATLSEREATAARRSQAVAELGQLVANESTADGVVAVLSGHAAHVVDATSTTVTLLAGASTGPPADPAALPVTDAARTGRLVLVGDRPEYGRRYPASLDDIVAAGTHAVAGVPMLASDRKVLGALGFAWDAPRAFGPLDVAALTSIAEFAGRTLERLFFNAGQQRRAETLGELARRLAATVNRADIAEVVGEVVPRVVESRYAQLFVLDERGAALRNLTVSMLPARLAERYRSVSLETKTPAVDAFVAARPITIADPAAFAELYPDLVETLAESGLRATGDLPLRDADGRTSGVLALAWPQPMVFDPTVRATLATVTDLIGQTLERAGLYEGEHEVVSALQRRLLRPLPHVSGLDVAAHYEPASKAVGMGGDWYDGVALPDGSLVLVVGDVVGHGVEAVAAMAQLQNLIAGLIRSGTPLANVFAQAGAMLAREDGIYATAQILHVDPVGRRLGYLNAGHPWALLRLPDGTVRRLREASQPLIGAPLRSQALSYEDFVPGAVLLAYTDGLIERRVESIVGSIDRLAGRLAEVDPTRPAEELLRTLVSTAREPKEISLPLDDDVAAVLIRSRPA